MNKKLLAVAVAGALAAPGMAFAQASTVTISGNFKLGVESLNVSNASATRYNSSQIRVVDNSSRIIFNSVEDLGNGLSAIGQLDVRFAPDQASSAPTSNPIGSGNTFVGLRSKTWGTLAVGRFDLHYGNGPSENTRNAGALVSSDVSLFDYIGGNPIATTSRTQNVVKYDSPNFNGLAATLAWSANPVGNSDADMTAPVAAGANTRKGDGWNIMPTYSNGPFSAVYSYWRAKPDAVVAATNDQRGDSLQGKYAIGGFQIGLGWNKSKLENSTTGIKYQQRTAWELAAHYKWGPNAVYGHYVRAGNVSSNTAGVATDQTSARMLSLTYEYLLSKRTALGATYAKINNDANINYNFFTTSSLGSTDAGAVGNGENPRIFQVTINHKF
jgi:predicted porin